MSLPKPLFVCGTYSFLSPHPSDWTIKPLIQVSKNTTLNGTETRDTTWRKYQYELVWDNMSNLDYDQLEALFNYSIDSRTPISFLYEKYPQTSTTIQVLGELSDRKFKAGSGKILYYSGVTVTLVEKVSRV